MTSFAGALDGFADTLNSLLQSPEQRRAARARDTEYTGQALIILELILPSGLAEPSGSYLLPFKISPQGISVTEPFSNDVTPTQRGGLYVEQSGIISRRIRLRGTTGFWPTEFAGRPPLNALPSSERSSSRRLPRLTGDPLSGFRQMQWIVDTLRLYGDLARKPETSGEVRLVYHDVQSQEDWLVIPESIAHERNAQSPLTSTFDLSFLCVDKASAPNLLTVSRETSLLASLKNAYRATQAFLDRADRAVVSLSAMQQDLSITVHGVTGTLAQVGTLIGAVGDFVAGTTRLVQAPFSIIGSLGFAAEQACRLAFNAKSLGASLVSWPRDASLRFRIIQTSLEQLALSSTPFARTPSVARGRQVAPPVVAQPPTSFAALRQLGSSGASQTGSLPTTAATLQNDDVGTVRYTVQSGDSLSNLAARYLGSATLWSEIASINGFVPPLVPDAPARAPYADTSFYGSVLRIGDDIAIPSDNLPSAVDVNVPVVGAAPEAPTDERTLGVDLLLRTDARGQLDLALGQEGGLPDLAAVGGLPNMEQAAKVRLGTERGTAVMTPNFGLQRMVGTGQADVDVQQVQLRVIQVLEEDPRVQSVEDLQVVPKDDAVGLEMTLRLIDGAGQAALALAV